jgi:hypothetical protein
MKAGEQKRLRVTSKSATSSLNDSKKVIEQSKGGGAFAGFGLN